MARTAVARKAPAPPARRPPPRPAPAPAKLPAPAPTLGAPAGGAPLAPQVAAPIAESLGVDVSPVRVHTGPTAASAAAALNARAFALGSHVVLGAGERPTDLGLMGHEVAHAVQQQAAPRVQLWTATGGDVHEREAQRAAEAVTAGRRFSVQGRTRPRVQRLGIGDVLDWFADKANLIPGYRLFTVIIGVNPINMSRVERSGANILRALVELVPGGNLITRALDTYGVFERAGAFVEQQFRTLGLTGQMFRDALMRFLDSLGWRDLFRPGSVWERAKRIFTEPIGRLIEFGRNLVAGIVRLIKDAILRPLAALASRTPAWDLLCAVLGRNPITGDPVPRTAETLIGGFMKLIGQEEVWRNIQRARAIPRAFAWFQGVLGGLLGFVSQIPRMFLDALRSLELADIVLLPSAFAKVGRAFAGFIGRFIAWAGQQVLGLLQIIFEVVAPGAVPYLRKAAGAFRQIISNPVGFIRNLVRAGIQGFRQFGSNFLNHLRRSLIEWLTGTLAGSGVYIPQAFELREIVKFVLSVLGLTWQNLRAKLVRLVPDPVVRALETGFDLVVTLVREGPAAAWDKIRESLSNLREMVMEQIMTFVRDNVVTAAVTRLVSSLNPAGAFIQAIIAIYNTVMFFVERLRQIAQVAMSFIDSISAIAAGGIGTAANRVEQTMAGLLTLVISFLARLVGLGNVADAVKRIVDRIRAPIDRALDRVVGWIVGQARRLGRLVVRGTRAAVAIVLRFTRRRSFSAGGQTHQTWISEDGEPQTASTAMALGVRLAGWRRRLPSLPEPPQSSARGDLGTAAQLMAELRTAARDALRARNAGNVAAVDTAQTAIDAKQTSLQPTLARLFIVFSDTATAAGAQEEARLFALMEAYDRVVVPLKPRFVSGSPGSVSRTFRTQWNRGGSGFAIARGFATHMERVLEAARNVGRNRFPYLTGVEIRLPGARVDYTTRDRDASSAVPFDVATEVKHWGALRERTARSGRTITIAEQVQRRMVTLRNQIQTSLRGPYTMVVLEVRGRANMPPELTTALDAEIAAFHALAQAIGKRFVARSI
jgi:Domain of unknown function (DUF4157)